MAEAILDGTFVCPLEVDQFTQQFFQSLQHPPVALHTSLEISCNDFIAYWHCTCECTSSSLSGVHFGHYKATMSSLYLAEIHALMTQIPFMVAYTPCQWQAGLQVILQKKGWSYSC